MQVFSSSWYFPVLSVGFWKCLLLAARARKYLASSSRKRRFAIHWGQGKSKAPSPSHTAAPPCTSSPYIIFTHKSVGNHVLERNAGKVWGELSSLPLHWSVRYEGLKKHGAGVGGGEGAKEGKKKEEIKKIEPENSEIKKGKNMKVFVSNINIDLAAHYRNFAYSLGSNWEQGEQEKQVWEICSRCFIMSDIPGLLKGVEKDNIKIQIAGLINSSSCPISLHAVFLDCSSFK